MTVNSFNGMNHEHHGAPGAVVFYVKVMMMNDEEWELAKLRDLQEKNRKDAPVQPVLLSLPSLTPKPALGVRINERFEQYRQQLHCPGTRAAIVWKVARAVEEGRVEESKIASIFPRLENASNRGAYFVASAKGAFLSCGLSWHEEDWSDA